MFNSNKSHVKKIHKIAQKVFALEEKYKAMSDTELTAQTGILKEELKNGKSLNDILPQAFATAREAAWRVLGMRPFEVQIMGGICLFQGRIAEMKTGEGKTLVSVMPAYLSALAGKGVHIVTVNDYLAKRDAEWMGKIHRFLGLTVGVSLPMDRPERKREAYACDITYATNNEIGFDYLRDNLAANKKDRCQRGLEFCIIDEIDSILIDESRTPLIISGQGAKPADNYVKAAQFAKKLTADDVTIEIKEKTVRLSDKGVVEAEKFYGVENLGDLENLEMHHYINNALRAKFIMQLNDDYIVSNKGEILIVDTFTGRVMEGRRFSNGLHQAIEAKEGVEIKNESQTMATITFQNLFRMYKKLSGMTGTAKTEEQEFNKIYNLDVVVLPTNKPSRRVDQTDVVFRTTEAKLNAIAKDVVDCAERGQPVLVGVTSIEKSEVVSLVFKKHNIKHTVLNAKNHELEGEIIAQAGRYGSVTVATNMAGRGTDILLGGNAEYLAKAEMKQKEYPDEIINAVSAYKLNYSEEEQAAKKVYDEILEKYKVQCAEEKIKVLEAGGLRVLGSERHESRRIDNQLRGRSGRQGDIGSSLFYLSFEDDLVKRFGGEWFSKVFGFFRVEENMPLQFRMLNKRIRNAQKQIEGLNFTQRRYVLEYDDVMNKHRSIIYENRNKVLDSDDVHEEVIKMFRPVIEEAVLEVINDSISFENWDIEKLNEKLEKAIFQQGTNLFTAQNVENFEVEDAIEMAEKEALRQYNERSKEYEAFNWKEIERGVLLSAVNYFWVQHIDNMTMLREEVGLKGYGQQDPILSYKKHGYEMFEKMITNIQNQVSKALLSMRIEMQTVDRLEQERMQVMAMMDRQGVVRAGKSGNKPKAPGVGVHGGGASGRNMPCPCGSGKKYKNCCGGTGQELMRAIRG